MKFNFENLPKSQIKLEIEVSKEEFDGFVEKAYLSLSQNIELKGFRKGKVPNNIIEERVGKEGILAEAGDIAVKETYKQAIKKLIEEQNIEPISSGQVSIKKIAVGSPFVFDAVISILPKIELPDYKELAKKIKKNQIKIEEKEIEGTLKWVQRSRAKFTAKTGPAEKGDFVEIEYWSPDVKEINKENIKKDAFILGEGHFIPGFENVLTGMKAQEEKNNVSFKIPEDHSFKKIAGKEIVFNIKLNSIQKVEFPEMTDDFAKSLGKFENLESLKENIRRGISQEKEQAEKQRIRNEFLEKAREAINFEIPEILIERESEQTFESFKKDVPNRFNLSFEEYLKKTEKTEEELKKVFLPEAEKRVKNFLILREIGIKENIEVKETDIKEEVDKVLDHYSSQNQPKPDRQQIEDYVRETIKTEKIFNLIENLISK